MYEYRTQGWDNSPQELMRYIYSNNLSSAMLELDDNGEIISYEEYHPFGTTAYQATNSQINAVAKRYRYTGKERDEESGFYYHGARYYIPWLCRWTQCDPIGIKDGLNVYAYVSNNPVMLNDPSGTQSTTVEEPKTKKSSSSSTQSSQNSETKSPRRTRRIPRTIPSTTPSPSPSPATPGTGVPTPSNPGTGSPAPSGPSTPGTPSPGIPNPNIKPIHNPTPSPLIGTGLLRLFGIIGLVLIPIEAGPPARPGGEMAPFDFQIKQPEREPATDPKSKPKKMNNKNMKLFIGLCLGMSLIRGWGYLNNLKTQAVTGKERVHMSLQV